MSAPAAQQPERTTELAGDSMVHAQHPSRPRQAFCGAPVRGIILPLGTRLDCVVCAELERDRYVRRLVNLLEGGSS